MLVDALFNKYVPQDLVSKIELRRALNCVSMKKEEDPVDLFKAISGIKNKYNMARHKFPEEENIATVLNNAPAKYSTVFTYEQRVKGFALKIEYLQEAMIQLYRTIYGNKLNTNADTDIRLARNDASEIFFIGARIKVIKIINVQINTMAKIIVVAIVKIVVTEDAVQDEEISMGATVNL